MTETPVLIVGAGPAGLMAATTLARHGVECLVVERRRRLSDLPRATVISTRSMEILRSWGLEGEVLAGGVDVDWLLWECETLADADGTALPVGYPTREQSAVLSPTAPACVPQDHLEPVLLRHLRSLGAAQVELGAELVHIDDERATLRDGRTVECQFVVAADGAYSAVRAAAGIAMRGPDRLADAVTALFRAPLWRVLDDRRYGIYSAAAGTFLPAGPGDRWLYGGYDAREDEAWMTRHIRLGAGVPDLELRIERIGSFTFAAQMAERFREGRTFLVGDAAHRVTPRGGTGMNIAMQDGFDLGWKLAWVLRGWAGEDLLDSYEAERRPVAEHNLARSADPNGSIRSPEQELHVDIGGRISHVWLADGVSTLDLLGPGLTLFAGPEWAGEATAPGGVPVTVRSLPPIAARALGVPGDGALLVRPDGRPVAPARAITVLTDTGVPLCGTGVVSLGA